MIRPARSGPGMFTLISLTALSTLTLNMFLPSLVNMARDFDTDYAFISISVSGYLAVTAFLQILIGPLSDRVGRRPVMIAALAIFVLASVGCLLATDLRLFLFFRMLQGVAIAGSVLAPAIVRDTHSAQGAAGKLGYIAMAMAVVPMLGPVAGGVLDTLFGWRSAFAVFTFLGFALLVLVWLDLGETRAAPNKSRDRPFAAQVKLLKSGRLLGYSLCMAFSTGGFYIFLTGAPLVGRAVFSTSAATLGFYIGSITAGFFLGSFLAGRLAPGRSLAGMMVAGRIVACAGLSAGIVLAAMGYVHEVTFFGATIFVGIGNGITMPSSSAGAMSINPELAASAAGIAGAMVVGLGAILTAVTGMIVAASPTTITLLALMLASSFAGLGAALFIQHLDRQEHAA